MALRREAALKIITERVAWLATLCELRGAIHLFDANTIAHEFYCRLLNEIYDLKLIVLDRIHANFPAIDLGDETNKRSFQITADKSTDKIQATLDLYAKRDLAKTHGRIQVLVIGKKQAAYDGIKVPEGVTFAPDVDIVDTKGLLRIVDGLTTEKLETIAEIVQSEIKLGESQRRSPVHNLPVRRARNLFGRQTALTTLADLIGHTTALGVSISASIEGLAGIGKTELALHLVGLLAQKGRFPGGIFWINAERADLTMQWGTTIADSLDVSSRDGQHDRANEVIRRIVAGGDVLIVLDNVEDWTEATIPRPLPHGPQVHLLCTTRKRNLGGQNFEHFDVEFLSPEAARELLVTGAHNSSWNETELQPLLSYLGGYTLALELAGAYLAEYPGTSPGQYLAMLQRGEEPETTVASLSSYERTVNQALAASCARLLPGAQLALRIAARVTDERANTSLLSACGVDQISIRALRELHIVQSDPSTGQVTSHRLVRAFGLRYGTPDEQHEAQRALATGIFELAEISHNSVQGSGRRSTSVGQAIADVSMRTFADNFSPLLAHLVRARLWSGAITLRAIDWLAREDARAEALGRIYPDLSPTDKQLALAHAKRLPRQRRAALARLLPNLGEELHPPILAELLTDDWLFWALPSSLKHLLSRLPRSSTLAIADGVRRIETIRLRQREMLHVAADAVSLSVEERLELLHEAVLQIESNSNDATSYDWLEAGRVAAQLASDEEQSYLRMAWAAAASGGDSRSNILRALLERTPILDAATKTAVFAASWEEMRHQPTGWASVSMLGPLLARYSGEAHRVLEITLTINEHDRGMTLAALLEIAPELEAEVTGALAGIKKRHFALEPLAYRLKALPTGHRSRTVDEVLSQGNRRHASSILAVLARQLVPGDPEIQRVLAAARCMNDVFYRIEALTVCLALVDDEQQGATFREILEAGRLLGHERMTRRIPHLLKTIEGDAGRLLDVVQMLRDLGDANALTVATDALVDILAKRGHLAEAFAIVQCVLNSTAEDAPYAALDVLAAMANGVAPDALPSATWAEVNLFVLRIPDAAARAVGMAILLRVVPSGDRGQLVQRLNEESEALPNAFDRCWTAAHQLVGALGAERPGAISAALAPSDAFSLRQRARLVHRGWSNMEAAEREANMNVLELLVEDLLRMADEEDIGISWWIEELVPFLPIGQTLRLLNLAHSSMSSLIFALAARLAKHDVWDQAMDALGNYVGEYRAAALAMLAEYAPIERRERLIVEARQLLEGVQDTSKRTEPLSLLLPYLSAEERVNALEAIASAAPEIHHDSTRRAVLARIASSAAADLRLPRRTEILCNLIDRLARHRREDFAQELAALAPLLLAVLGPGATRDVALAILDAGRCFP